MEQNIDTAIETMAQSLSIEDPDNTKKRKVYYRGMAISSLLCLSKQGKHLTSDTGTPLTEDFILHILPIKTIAIEITSFLFGQKPEENILSYNTIEEIKTYKDYLYPYLTYLVTVRYHIARYIQVLDKFMKGILEDDFCKKLINSPKKTFDRLWYDIVTE